MVADFRRRFWVSLVLTVPVLVLAPLIQGLLGLREALAFTGDSYLQWAVATVIFLYGGWPFLKGLYDELGERQPGMMTLIALAITVAYAYSSVVVFGLEGKVFFWELATLVDVMLLGHWIEMRSVMGASGALEELVELMPSEAHRLVDDDDGRSETEDVPVRELRAGDRVVVKPGEKVPADGVVREGRTTVNESMVTGESRPVEKGADDADEVIGGSINGESAVTVEVSKTGDDSYLSQVVRMVSEAQESRSRTQDLANRAALWLTIVALSVGVGTLIGWLAFGYAVDFSLERMVTVMVITCPHALGLAIPLVVAVSTTLAASRGLLIRDRASFERARKLDAVVLDKTGTLTQGTFRVQGVVPLSHEKDGADADSSGSSVNDEAAVLRLAAAVEQRSEHSLAAGIVARAREDELEIPSSKDFQAIPGQGAEAEVEETRYRVVSPRYLEEHSLTVDDDRIRELAEAGHTVVYLLREDVPLGAIALGDTVRPESAEAIRRLQQMGVRTVMLTGDAEPVARAVARELGIDEVFAEVLPDRKAEQIRELRERGLAVAMVGDGVNDAPALAEADLGVAIGAGTDVAAQTADVVLVRSDPRDVTAIVELARATHAKMVQNLWWATGYNVVAIPLAAGVLFPLGFLLPPAVGAMVMSLSTVIVAINARLLGRADKDLPGGESGSRKEARQPAEASA